MVQIYKKYIFFRDDDVACLNNKLKRLMDIFMSHKIPIHFSLIPNKLTERCRYFLIEKIKIYKNLIEIGQHGFSHKNYSLSTDKFNKYEFGAERPYKKQNQDIVKGKKILQNFFEKKMNIFTPPWHGFDRNTLCILAKEGFSAISAGHKNIHFNVDSNLRYIPVDIDFNKRKHNGEWFTMKNSETIKKINRIKKPGVGILLHHNAFNDEDDFNRLDEFLYLLKKNELIKFINLSKSVRFDTGTIQRDALAYYLNYQFVPKPLTIIRNSVNPENKRFNFDYSEEPKVIRISKDYICRNIYSKLKKVIMRQLPDKRKPIGILLSGGLDSAAVLHTIRELTDRKIYTLTGAYHKKAENLIFAERMSKKYNTIHNDLIINPEDLEKMDELYAKNIPQPIGDNGFLPAYLMLAKLNEYTDTVFAGDGADCLFRGLKMHRLSFIEKNNNSRLNSEMADSGKRWLAYEHYKFGEIFLSEEELAMLFERNYNTIKLEFPLERVIKKIKVKDTVKRQVLIDLNFLVKNRVDYIVYAAKANAMDFKLPYLDKEFVNLAIGIPAEYLIIQPERQKYMLKSAFKNKLPREILDREREGFTPPFKLWYQNNAKFVIEKLIKSKKLGISEVFIKHLIKHYRNLNDYEAGMKIWLILNLVSWYEHNRKLK